MKAPPRAAMKQLEVTILGQGYVLACPAGGEALLQQAVARVDEEMSAIRDAGKIKARERIAVLAALNLAYQLAERQVEPVAPVATAPAPVAGPARDVADETVDLDALLRRVDAALGHDGQLI